MTGRLLVRLGSLLRLLPLELRAGDLIVAPDREVPLPSGRALLTVSARLRLPRASADARIDVPLWIEPGGTTVVDLARLLRAYQGVS